MAGLKIFKILQKTIITTFKLLDIAWDLLGIPTYGFRNTQNTLKQFIHAQLVQNNSKHSTIHCKITGVIGI